MAVVEKEPEEEDRMVLFSWKNSVACLIDNAFQCGSSSERKPKSATQSYVLSEKLQQLSKEKRLVGLILTFVYFNRSILAG